MVTGRYESYVGYVPVRISEPLDDLGQKLVCSLFGKIQIPVCTSITLIKLDLQKKVHTQLHNIRKMPW